MTQEKLRNVLIRLYDFPDNYKLTAPKLASALNISTNHVYVIIDSLLEHKILNDTGECVNGRHPSAKIYKLDKNSIDVLVITSDNLARKVVKRIVDLDFDTRLLDEL